MKNLLILGISFVVLFVGAAGVMQVYLQQTKPTAENKDAKDKDDKKGKDDKGGIKEPEKVKPKAPDREPAKDDPLYTSIALKAEREALKQGEARLEKRKAQMELILQDIRAERDEADKLNKHAEAELKRHEELRAQWEAQRKLDEENNKKNVAKTPFAGAIPPKPADLPDPNEKKNVEKMAVMFESMAPETAAKIVQQMADGGKMATAVKVLLQMRERSAGRLIEQIPDPALAAQILGKIQETKRPPVVPTAAVTPPG